MQREVERGRMASVDWSNVRDRLAQFGQEHLLQFLDELGEREKAELYKDISEIDLSRVAQCFQEAQLTMTNTSEKKDELLQPLDKEICGSTARDRDSVPRWERIGLKLISQGKVGVLLLAGGQGTRLGVKYPKGMYDVGLPSGKPLYQLQAERIFRLQELAWKRCGLQCTIPWYIMTSEHTRAPTIEFFEQHGYFGLDRKNVVVFEQNTLPCLEFNGKIILSEKHRIAKAPDGNGGLYATLVSPHRNILQDMESRGIQYVHVYGVDNILIKMADPVFAGFCVEKGVECGAKVVRKASPTERVGVVCKCDGKYQVVEYSEISIQTAEKRDPDGSLTFNAGNTCNHFFSTDFLRAVCRDNEQDLKHHIAKKKISHVDTSGQRIDPSKPNGIKMEKFVFDVFQFTQKFAVLEVLREEEFSPLKNASGADKDTPATARAALLDLHYRQILAAGGTIMDDDEKPLPLIPHRHSPCNDNGTVVCEISPLLSYFGEDLEEICSGQKFKAPLHLDESSVTNGLAPASKKPKND